MKRFTDTEKWAKPWFRTLPARVKCLWSYLCDHCDHAGVIEPDWEAFSFYVGEPVSADDLACLNGNVITRNGKLFLPQYVEFQYGRLSRDSKPHTPVFKAIANHGLTLDELYRKPTDSLSKGLEKESLSIPFQRVQDKDKEEEEEKDKEGGSKGGTYHPDSRTALYWLREATGRSFRETDANLGVISARLKEPGVDIEGVKLMLTRQCSLWKTDPKMCEYLRPETLFNKTKFDSYYAARLVPVSSSQSNPGRNSIENPVSARRNAAMC